MVLGEKRQSRSETNRPGGSAVRETSLFRDRQSVRSAATVLAKNLRRPRAVPEQMKRIGLALVLSPIATAYAERGLPTASGPQPRVTANHVTEGSDIELSDERLVFGEVAPGESATQDVAIQNVGSEDLGRWTHSLALIGARLELQHRYRPSQRTVTDVTIGCCTGANRYRHDPLAERGPNETSSSQSIL